MTIVLNNLRISAGTFTIFCGHLEVKDNEYLVLLGPTGSGKTMLLETLAGFRSPESGSIQVNGTEFATLPSERRNFALVHQDHLLFPHMSVRDNIVYGLLMKGLTKNEIGQRVEEITDYLDIKHLINRSIDGLSGGERQIICLARAVISEPDLLLLDEPLGATDPMRRDLLEKKMKNLHDGLGCPTIHVCHNFGEASRLADRIAVMINGELCAAGSAESIFRTPPKIEVARFLGHQNIFRVAGRKGTKVLAAASQEETTAAGQPVSLTVERESPSAAHLMVCAEDIEILPLKKHGWAWKENTFKGKIVRIEEYGSHKQVRITFGLKAFAHLSQREINEKELKPGLEILVRIPPEAIHLF